MPHSEIDEKYQKALVDSIVDTLTKNGYTVSDGKIRKVLFSEVGILVMIVSFMIGIIAPYFTITKDIALIQQNISTINSNHEVHIQDILTDIKEMKQRQSQEDLLIQQNQDAILAIMNGKIQIQAK